MIFSIMLVAHVAFGLFRVIDQYDGHGQRSVNDDMMDRVARTQPQPTFAWAESVPAGTQGTESDPYNRPQQKCGTDYSPIFDTQQCQEAADWVAQGNYGPYINGVNAPYKGEVSYHWVHYGCYWDTYNSIEFNANQARTTSHYPMLCQLTASLPPLTRGVGNRLARVIEALESELVEEHRDARGAKQYCNSCNGWWRTCCGVGGGCGCTRYRETSDPQCYKGDNPCFS